MERESKLEEAKQEFAKERVKIKEEAEIKEKEALSQVNTQFNKGKVFKPVAVKKIELDLENMRKKEKYLLKNRLLEEATVLKADIQDKEEELTKAKKLRNTQKEQGGQGMLTSEKQKALEMIGERKERRLIMLEGKEKRELEKIKNKYLSREIELKKQQASEIRDFTSLNKKKAEEICSKASASFTQNRTQVADEREASILEIEKKIARMFCFNQSKEDEKESKTSNLGINSLNRATSPYYLYKIKITLHSYSVQPLK